MCQTVSRPGLLRVLVGRVVSKHAQVLQRLRPSFAKGTSRPGAVGNARAAGHGLRCRSGAASRSATAHHREKIRLATQRCSHCKVVVRGSWNESNGAGEHLSNFSRGSRLPLWRPHEEGHALLATRAWAGALLATQRHAGNVATGEVGCPISFRKF